VNGFLRKKTSNDVVLGNEMPFGVPDDYILYLVLNFGKTAILETALTGQFFAAENRFYMRMLQYKTTLNRRRSPIKVV